MKAILFDLGERVSQLGFKCGARALCRFGVLLTLAAAIQSACSGEEPNRDRVDFFFTHAEWKEYGRRIKQSNRSDFSLSVRMGEHREAVRATAHLRGRGSFGCARRNYTLNLPACPLRAQSFSRPSR